MLVATYLTGARLTMVYNPKESSGTDPVLGRNKRITHVNTTQDPPYS